MEASISNNGESTVAVPTNSTHHVRKFNDARCHDYPIYSLSQTTMGMLYVILSSMTYLTVCLAAIFLLVILLLVILLVWCWW